MFVFYVVKEEYQRDFCIDSLRDVVGTHLVRLVVKYILVAKTLFFYCSYKILLQIEELILLHFHPTSRCFKNVLNTKKIKL